MQEKDGRKEYQADEGMEEGREVELLVSREFVLSGGIVGNGLVLRLKVMISQFNYQMYQARIPNLQSHPQLSQNFNTSTQLLSYLHHNQNQQIQIDLPTKSMKIMARLNTKKSKQISLATILFTSVKVRSQVRLREVYQCCRRGRKGTKGRQEREGKEVGVGVGVGEEIREMMMVVVEVLGELMSHQEGKENINQIKLQANLQKQQYATIQEYLHKQKPSIQTPKYPNSNQQTNPLQYPPQPQFKHPKQQPYSNSKQKHSHKHEYKYEHESGDGYGYGYGYESFNELRKRVQMEVEMMREEVGRICQEVFGKVQEIKGQCLKEIRNQLSIINLGQMKERVREMNQMHEQLIIQQNQIQPNNSITTPPQYNPQILPQSQSQSQLFPSLLPSPCPFPPKTKSKQWIDPECFYYNQLTLSRNTILAKNMANIFGANRLTPLRCEFSVKIQVMQGVVGLGVVDRSMRGRQVLGDEENWVVYWSDGEYWNGVYQGYTHRYHQKQTVTVHLNFPKNTISWKIGEQVRFSTTHAKINDDSIVWVPYILLWCKNDKVSIVG